MSEFVTAILKSMGVAGAAISILLTTITLLGTVIVALWKQNNAHNKARLSEREALIKIVESNNTALNRNSDATEERNRVTQELADAIGKQAAAFEMVNQRVEFYHSDNRDKLSDVRKVIDSMSDALRVNTGMVTDVRNGNIAILNAVQQRRGR
jgi:uncharacterized protein HemX